MSVVVGGMGKWVEVHTCWHTTATASAKVGWSLRYHATCLTGGVSSCARCSAHNITIENSPRGSGVVRAMANSFHCCCVSRPKCARASYQVTSKRHHSANHFKIWTGSTVRSVHSKAWGSNSTWGSHTRTQRMGSGSIPE
jgi:hypothetical protein